MTESTDGILNIDGFQWTNLKQSVEELKSLSPKDRDKVKQREEETFSLYHKRLQQWIENHGGSIWLKQGDCCIASWFPNIDEAVAAAKTVQRRLTDFNHYDSLLANPLIVRIGVSLGKAPNVIPEKRGEFSSPELDEAGHLQKHCPPGGIRISKHVFNQLNYGRHDFRPGLGDPLMPKITNSFVWVERSLTPQEVEHVSFLTSTQKRSYPLVAAPLWTKRNDRNDIGFRRIPEILPESLIVIGETRSIRKDSNSPINHPAPTSDAVGIIEILAASQSSTRVCAGIDEWVDTCDLASQMNLVVIGSPVVNVYSYAINNVLKCGFELEKNGLLRIRVVENGSLKFFPEKVEHAEVDRHYGLVYLSRNPINPKYFLLWIAGISGMATQACARFVRDIVLNATRTLGVLRERFQVSEANAAVIVPRAEGGWELNDYLQGIWRVTNYDVIWAGKQV